MTEHKILLIQRIEEIIESDIGDYWKCILIDHEIKRWRR